MPLTADVVRNAPVYTNAINERELSLRALRIVIIENLAVSRDMFDTIDFSDNSIVIVDNFPRLERVRSLIFNNNEIITISSSISFSLPYVETLILTNNRIAKLVDLKPLFSLFKSLQRVSLVNNPVSRVPFYRYFLIQGLPKLRILDFVRITDKERKKAIEYFKDLDIDTFLGQQIHVDEAHTVATEDLLDITATQKKMLKQLIANTTDQQELDILANYIKLGKVPKSYFS